MLSSHHEPVIPPSHTLKEFYLSLKGSTPTGTAIEEIAKKTLLPVSEVTIWLDHLKTVDMNRKRGATKAAATRSSKNKTQFQQ